MDTTDRKEPIPEVFVDDLCRAAFQMVLNLKRTPEGRKALEDKKSERSAAC